MYGKSCALIGAVHLPAMPGAAGYCGSMDQVIEEVLRDASIYKEEGFDALVVENTADAPYLKGRVYPETIAAMTVVSKILVDEIKLPLGIQVLAGANIEALAIANSLNLDFIRVEGFVFAHVADEGVHEACSPELIRKRFDLRADHIKIYADIKKKHASHAITDDVSLEETGLAAEMFKADGVVVSGVRTGAPPDPSEAESVKNTVSVPVLIGSGVNPDNLPKFAAVSDALIIGSYLKEDGKWQNPVDKRRCSEIVAAAN